MQIMLIHCLLCEFLSYNIFWGVRNIKTMVIFRFYSQTADSFHSVRHALWSSMTSIFLLLISAVALVGIFSNIRMLIFSCFNIKKNHSTLRKLRPFVVCQFIYQVTVLVITTIQAAWRGLGYVELQESYMYVFNTLVTSLLILLGCNVMVIYVIIISPDHPEASKHRQFLSRLLLLAAVLIGFIVSVVLMWHGHEFGLQGIIIAILVVLILITLFAQFSDSSTLDQVEEIKVPLESTSLCNTIKENKEIILIASLAMLSCGGMIALVSLPGILIEILSKENVFYLHVLVINSFHGWIMPLGLIYFSNSRQEGRSEMKEAA